MGWKRNTKYKLRLKNGNENQEEGRKKSFYMQLLRKNIFQYLLLSTIWLHQKQWDCGISCKWISGFFTHVNWNLPPGQWWVKHFRCWWTVCRQEQASQKPWDLCLARETGDDQRFQNLEQGDDAAHSLAAPKLTNEASPRYTWDCRKPAEFRRRVAFFLNDYFFSIHV